MTFINREGEPLKVKAKVGDTFLDAAVNNDVDLEGFGQLVIMCILISVNLTSI